MKLNFKIISGVFILAALFLATAFSIVENTNPVAKIELEKTKVLYLGAENPVLVSVPGVKPEDISLNVYGGHIKKDSLNPDRFFLSAASPLKVYMEVKVRSGNTFKIIATDSFRVKDIQDPVLYFGSHSRDCSMSLDEIRRETGLFSRMVNCDFDGRFLITSFSMSVFSNGIWIDSTTGGPAFTEAQKKDLAALQSGDRIIFHHINVKGFGEIIRTIPGMYVTVQ
jgi:hypothetical protein